MIGVSVTEFTWSTVSFSVVIGSVVTSAAMYCAWAVAVLTARSAASVRSTRASGIRKETSTRELVAATSRMTRSLMGAG